MAAWFILCLAAEFGACSDRANAADKAPQNDAAERIAQRIELKENRTVFTLFAMLNAAGYDEEVGSAIAKPAGAEPDMHPVRRGLRAALARRLPDSVFARLDAYYKAHRADLAAYTAAALRTSGPPNFTPGPTWAADVASDPSFKVLADLPATLRRFYRAFPVDSIYDADLLTYRAYMVEVSAALKRDVAAALRYARVESASELAGFSANAHLVVIPNLLMSHERSFSFVIGDTFYSVDGPQPASAYNPKEFVRSVTRAVSFDTVRVGSAQQRALAAYLAVRNLPVMAPYQTLSAFVDENLTRAVLVRYRASGARANDAMLAAQTALDAKAGFVLVPYFCEQLQRYESQTEPLHQYYPKLFEQLDARHETARWRDSSVR